MHITPGMVDELDPAFKVRYGDAVGKLFGDFFQHQDFLEGTYNRSRHDDGDQDCGADHHAQKNEQVEIALALAVPHDLCQIIFKCFGKDNAISMLEKF